MTERLPPVPWTQRRDLAALVAALGTENVRWVGGAVRDTLLGEDVHDIDAATTLPPTDVVERLAAAGIRTIPTGIAHGTVTALMDGSNVEVTTLRRDVSTDGRRATVSFAQDWRDDAARRDFTINALFAHPVTLEIADYFGGREDLRLAASALSATHASEFARIICGSCVTFASRPVSVPNWTAKPRLPAPNWPPP